MTVKIFAYGTLRNSRTATHQVNGFDLYSYGKFPYVVGDTTGTVLGNLLEIDEKKLPAYDLYENVAGGLYTRELVTVYEIETGATSEAYIYVATSLIHPPLIPSGDWFNR